MEHRKQHLALIAAVALLALGSGCVTADANKTESKKPDVTQPGVLPSPQEAMKPASAVAASGAVVPAGGVVPAGAAAPGPVANAPLVRSAPATPAGPSAIAKLTGRMEKKVPASEMAVAWRNRIAYLPDPTRNGSMGAGLAGQLFLFGPRPKMEFAQADGTLTVDLIDETPRPPGQPAATPERWQFDKNTLRNLVTADETFGKSYVLFLPWPAYRPDITRVRISARYDPDNGHTLFAAPTTVSIDTSAPLGAPVWDQATSASSPVTGGAMRPQPFGGSGMQPMPPAGGMTPGAPTSAGGLAPAPIPLGGGPVAPNNGGPMMPLAPTGAPGAAPLSGSTLEGLPPIAITIGKK